MSAEPVRQSRPTSHKPCHTTLASLVFSQICLQCEVLTRQCQAGLHRGYIGQNTAQNYEAVRSGDEWQARRVAPSLRSSFNVTHPDLSSQIQLVEWHFALRLIKVGCRYTLLIHFEADVRTVTRAWATFEGFASSSNSRHTGLHPTRTVKAQKSNPIRKGALKMTEVPKDLKIAFLLRPLPLPPSPSHPPTHPLSLPLSLTSLRPLVDEYIPDLSDRKL